MPDWKKQLYDEGYAHFRGLVSPRLIAAARRAIDEDLARNYDPARQAEYENQSFCPGLRQAPEISSLFDKSGLRRVCNRSLGRRRYYHGDGQIAIRKAHNAPENFPPVAHIDGIPTEHNGLPPGEIGSFTALAGVFLTEAASDFAGNFTVWPGSHRLVEDYFRRRGPEALSPEALAEGMPQLPLGEPVQLQCSPGDVVLCHYELAHTAAVNTSANDRYAIFFRIWLHEMDGITREERWQRLSNLWQGWKEMRRRNWLARLLRRGPFA